MIILSFILDYIIMVFLPIDTYFIINDIDKNKLFNVFIIGFLLDIMYHKLLINLLLLLFFYFIVKKISIKNKFYYIKNIILFIIYFFLINQFSKTIISFFISFILQVFYMFLYKKLLK